MSPSIDLVSPLGSRNQAREAYARRLPSLTGRKLGILANGKLNAAGLVAAIGTALQQQFGVADIVAFEKPQRGAPVSADGLALLTACDAVVNGVGD